MSLARTRATHASWPFAAAHSRGVRPVFASFEAGFVRFGDAVATGSSLMPQKRNPDAMELIRGKAAKVQGSLQSMLSLLKGLPLGYNRDLQIDKEVMLPALDATNQCLLVAATAIENAEFDTAHCAAQASRGYLNATDLADLLVAQGVPFRDAHGIAGQAVNRAVELKVELHELPKSEQAQLLPQLQGDWLLVLDADADLNPQLLQRIQSHLRGPAWGAVQLRKAALLPARGGPLRFASV